MAVKTEVEEEKEGGRFEGGKGRLYEASRRRTKCAYVWGEEAREINHSFRGNSNNRGGGG
ncbi:hypothetical protein ACTXT7_016126, partial [Hymenolepis weldensis]